MGDGPVISLTKGDPCLVVILIGAGKLALWGLQIHTALQGLRPR